MTAAHTATPPAHKPLMRGVTHQVTFFVALVAGAVLTVLSPGGPMRVGVAIYAVACAALFGISALYHRPQWTADRRRWMRRLDHATIFVMIAGTGTPFAMALEPESRTRLLVIIWIGAAVGVIRAVAWINAPKPVVAVMAVAVGWVAWPFLPQFTQRLGTASLVLVAIGGVLYSSGAIIYAIKRPNPWPRVFGYHEFFHALVIVAAVVHFIAVARVALGTG